MSPRFTPSELERKRIRDRRSQSAMRARNKATISELQAQVTAYQERELILAQEVYILRRDVETFNLKFGHDQKIGIPKSQDFPLLSFPQPVRTSPASLLAPATEAPLTTTPIEHLDFTCQCKRDNFEQLPLNCEPTCLTDQMLHAFVVTQRLQLQHDLDQSPHSSVSFLVDPEPFTPPGIIDPVSTLLSDILLRYSEIDTLPRRISAFYLMYKILNWSIHRTKETYEMIPTWLQPLPIQLHQPHASWIDRVPWPEARAYLITHPQITYDDFAGVYSSSFDISWPYDDSFALLIAPKGLELDAGRESRDLNPVFQQHLGRLRNWTIGYKFRRRFPELGIIIDQNYAVDL